MNFSYNKGKPYCILIVGESWKIGKSTLGKYLDDQKEEMNFNG
jgi:hypothetical protein